MLRALYHIYWIDLRSSWNYIKVNPGSFATRTFVVMSLFLLGGWLLEGPILTTRTYLSSADDSAVKQVVHTLCLALTIVWLVLALQFNINSLPHNHLFRMTLLPWNLREVYSACLVRAITKGWIVVWLSVPTWLYLQVNQDSTLPTSIRFVFLILIFGSTMVAWIHVFKEIVERYVRTKAFKWVLRLFVAAFFLALNYLSASTKLGPGPSSLWKDSLVTHMISDYSVFTPPGMLAEAITRLQDLHASTWCILGLIFYTWLGWTLGLILTRKSLSVERTPDSTIGWIAPNSMFEWIDDRIGKLLPSGTAPLFVQELVYLLRWRRVWMMIGVSSFMLLVYLTVLRYRAPELIVLTGFNFCLVKFMFTYLNKEDKGIVHYYLLPFDLKSVIFGKNLAVLLLQYAVIGISLAISLTLLWQSLSWQKITSLTLYALYSPLFLLAIGNLVSISNPFRASRAYSSMITPETNSRGVIVVILSVATLLFLSVLAYAATFMFLGSENFMVLAYASIALSSAVLYFVTFPYSVRLMETRKHRMMTAFSVC